jgi:hypothetical protein
VTLVKWTDLPELIVVSGVIADSNDGVEDCQRISIMKWVGV